MNGLPMAPTEPLAIESILQVLSQYVRVGSGEAFTAARFALQSLQTLQSVDQVFQIVRDAYEKAKTTKVDPQMLERHRAVLETLQAQASFLQAQQMPAQTQPLVQASSTKSVLIQPGNVELTKKTEVTATPTAAATAAATTQEKPAQQKQQQQEQPVTQPPVLAPPQQAAQPLQQQQQPLSLDEQRRMRYLRIQGDSGNVIVALLTAVDNNDMSGAATLVQGVSDKDTLNRAFEASVLAFQTEKVAVKQQAHTQVQELLRQRFRQLEAAAAAAATADTVTATPAPTSSSVTIRVPTSIKTPTANSGPLPCWLYLIIGLVIIALIAGIVALIRGSGKKKKATTTTVSTETVSKQPPSSVKSTRSTSSSSAATAGAAAAIPMSPLSRSQEDALFEQQRRIRELQRQLDEQSRQVERMRQVQRLEQMAARPPSPFAAEERNTELSLADEVARTDSEIGSGF